MVIWTGIGLFVAGFAVKSPWMGFAGLVLITVALVRRPVRDCELDGTCEKKPSKD